MTHQGLTYEVEARDRDGRPLWTATAVNTLTAVALKLMLGSFFRNEELPERFWMGLSALPAGEIVKAVEPATNYSRVEVKRNESSWGPIELQAPDAVTLSVAHEFKNTSDERKWNQPVGVLFLSTEREGGELLSWAPLRETVKNGPREVFPGDTLTVKARASLRAVVAGEEK